MAIKRKGIILTEVQKKTRKHFCALIEYGMGIKELHLLSGHPRAYVRERIKKCNKLNKKGGEL